MPKRMLAAVMLLVGLAWSGTAHAQFTGSSRPNAFGGLDYYTPGKPPSYSVPNALGGYDYYTPGGRPPSYSVPKRA